MVGDGNAVFRQAGEGLDQVLVRIASQLVQTVQRRVRIDLFADARVSSNLQGLLGFDAVTGNFQSPYTPGSACELQHPFLASRSRQMC